MDEMGTILVVDDDQDVLSATVRILKKAGYRTLEALNGRECMETVSEYRPDLVLLDVVMPDIDGWEVCRSIKETPETRRTHVVLLSGLRTTPDNQADGLDCGADGYIARPFAKREFLSRVASVLRAKRAEDELRLEIVRREQTEQKLTEHRDHLEELVAARTAELNQANRLTLAINKVLQDSLACTTEEELAKNCLAVAEELTESQFGFIGQVNTTGRFDSIAMSALAWKQCTMSEGAAGVQDMEIRGFLGEVIIDGESKLLNDPASHAQWHGPPEGHPAISSFLGVPLRQNDKPIGMIALANKERGYTPRDREFVESLSAAFVGARMRKRAEMSERSLRAEQQLILDSVRALVWYKDTENTILRVNKAAAESIGLSVADIVGKTDAELFPEESEKYARDDQEVIQSGQPKYGIVQRLRAATGGKKTWVLTDKIPIVDDAGAVTGLIVFSIDITELKETQEDLERRARELRVMVNSMAGRENRMVELKNAVRKLRAQLERAGMVPVADE